jgi:hypothetical protein
VATEADFLRRQLTLTSVQAQRAEARVTALELERERIDAVVAGERAELLRLRGVVESQRAEIERLRERLREVEETARQVALETLVRALRGAIESGSRSLEGRVVGAARAEIRAALGIDHGTEGLVVTAPGVYGEQALSTITLDLRATPPEPEQEAAGVALAGLVDAALSVQRALDRELPAEAVAPARAALAQAAAFALTPELTAPDVATRLGPLATSVHVLAEQLPALAPSARVLEERRAALPPAPAAAALAAVAAALAAVGEALDALDR